MTMTIHEIIGLIALLAIGMLVVCGIVFGGRPRAGGIAEQMRAAGAYYGAPVRTTAWDLLRGGIVSPVQVGRPKHFYIAGIWVRVQDGKMYLPDEAGIWVEATAEQRDHITSMLAT